MLSHILLISCSQFAIFILLIIAKYLRSEASHNRALKHVRFCPRSHSLPFASFSVHVHRNSPSTPLAAIRNAPKINGELPMEDSSRSRNHPGLPCGEEIFLGASQLLPECCKISREGRSSGVWFQEGIVQTVMQAIKRERVCAQDEMGFELLESLCTLLQGERLLGTPHVSRVFSGLLMTTAPVTQQLRLLTIVSVFVCK